MERLGSQIASIQWSILHLALQFINYEVVIIDCQELHLNGIQMYDGDWPKNKPSTRNS